MIITRILHLQLAKDGFAKFTSYHFLPRKEGRKDGRTEEAITDTKEAAP